MIRSMVAAAVASTVLASPVQAGPIQMTDFSVAKMEVDFTNLPLSFGGTPVVVADGITFNSGAGSFRTYPTAPAFPGGPAVQVCAERGCIMTDVELDYISVDLPTPVAMVGALLGIPNMASAATAEFYAGTTLLGTVDIAAAAFEGVFAGWDAGADIITSVRFVDTINQGFVLGLTAFTYEAAATVPEPSSLALALLAAAGALGAARRRRAGAACGT